MKPLSFFLFFLCLYSMGGDRQKTSRKSTITQACWTIFCNLEKGLMGEKDLAKAEKLLKKAEGADRAWLVACIGQYHRVQRKQPIDGIKVLLNECLGDNAAKNWVRKLNAAESARLAEWRDQARTHRLKRLDPPLKPTGLALALADISA